MVKFFKRGQSESFLAGIILFILFMSVAIYFAKLFFIEKDCFGLLTEGINRAVNDAEKEISFSCGFKKPIAVFGKDDKYALKILPFHANAQSLVLKPENDECKDKSCVCSCGYLGAKDFEGFINDIGLLGKSPFFVFECGSSNCISYDKNILTHCAIDPQYNSWAKYPTNGMDCPFGMGGSFLIEGSPSPWFKLNLGFEVRENSFDEYSDLINTRIKFYPKLNLISIGFGEKPSLNLEILNSLYAELIRSIDDTSSGVDGIIIDNLFKRIEINADKESKSFIRYVAISIPYQDKEFVDFLLRDDLDNLDIENKLGIVFFISDKGMQMLLTVFTFVDNILTDYRFVELAKDERVSPCFNGKQFDRLLITMRDIDIEEVQSKDIVEDFRGIPSTNDPAKRPGVYSITIDPFTEEYKRELGLGGFLEMDNKNTDNSVMKRVLNLAERSKNLLQGNELSFRIKQDNKVCLYEKDFKESESDVTTIN